MLRTNDNLLSAIPATWRCLLAAGALLAAASCGNKTSAGQPDATGGSSPSGSGAPAGGSSGAFVGGSTGDVSGR